MENLKKKIESLLFLYKSKNLSKAEIMAKNLINSYPKIVFLYNVLGLILTSLNKTDEAIEWYEKGIKIQPDYAMIYNNLGSLFKSKENYQKAEIFYKKAISLDEKIPEPHNNLGGLYLDLNKRQEAIDSYKKAIKINSNFFASHYNLGLLYKSIGKFDQAKKSLEETIRLNKNFYTAHRVLSQITKYKKGNEHLSLLKKIYTNPKIEDSEKAELGFAIGKAYDDIKDFDKAFKYYKEGNNLRKREVSFSLKKVKKEFSIIKKIFNVNFFNKFKLSGNLDTSAIFILGMPRSGTTLIEQILSAHPSVYGADELFLLPNLVKKHFGKISSASYLNNIQKEKIKSIGQEYIDDIKKISKNSKKITDKLPINFKLIGFIKLILPNSKIVHCVRNSKDNSISIYKNYFANKDVSFAYDLDDIIEFYILYKDLMKHWNKTLSKFIIDIKYEKIIKDPKKQIRNLLKSCNLPWHNDCLKFYDNKRLIKTASDTQARKKIYKSSVDTWMKYEKHLKKNFKKLLN